MFLELLVATVCISGEPGCSTATSAYYESNKELQQSVKRMEKMGKELVRGNEYIVYAATPLYAVLSNKPASFKLGRNLNLNISVKQASIGLQWNY